MLIIYNPSISVISSNLVKFFCKTIFDVYYKNSLYFETAREGPLTDWILVTVYLLFLFN